LIVSENALAFVIAKEKNQLNLRAKQEILSFI
jgi:hypothetical protein